MLGPLNTQQVSDLQEWLHDWNEAIFRADRCSQVDTLHRTYGITVGREIILAKKNIEIPTFMKYALDVYKAHL